MRLHRDTTGDTVLTRHLPLTGTNWRQGVTAPTEVTIGTTPTVRALLFDAIAELLGTTFQMPDDWDTGTDPVLILKWSLTQIETDLDVASWSCDYTVSRENSTGNGPGRASSTATGTTTVTTANGLADGDEYTTEITLDRADATNPIAADNSVHPEIHLTNVSGVGAVHLTDAYLRYEATH